MRRFAFRLTAALLTFAIGVLLTQVRNNLRFPESLWQLYRTATSSDSDGGARKCFEGWENASSSQPLGWDLTYFSVMTRLRVCPGNDFCEQWAKPAPPIQKHVAEWQGDPIVSSFELELPDGHAGMVSLWFIRTKDQAYYWSFYPLDQDYSDGKHVIPTEDYDKVFEKISCWVPFEPRQPKFGAHGYVGFVSMYKQGKSLQMLLTYEDFIEGGEYPKNGNMRPGPFRRVLEPLVSALSERRRQPTENK